ncbi:MAG: hypothetical protein ABI629_10560 [bacterium]
MRWPTRLAHLARVGVVLLTVAAPLTLDRAWASNVDTDVDEDDGLDAPTDGKITDPDEIKGTDVKPRAHDEIPFPDAQPRAHDEIPFPDANPPDPNAP